MKKLFVHTTATALLLSQLGLTHTALAAENDTVSANDQVQKEDPSLVKGDFFYFVKTAVEKIHLLLTTDKVKEAELLAELAGERIHEAHVLIKEGKEDLAKETLQDALSKMESAQSQVDVQLPATNTTTDTTTNTTTDTTTNATTDTTTNATTETNKSEESGTTTATSDDNEKTEKDDSNKEEKNSLTKEQKEIAKIQHHLNNNLLVLADVLDQVKNPKAKAAIAKNIEKSFNKIAEKLEKVLKKSATTDTAVKPVITIKYPDATTNENTETPEVITTITKIEDVEDTTNKVETDEDNKSEADKTTEAEEVKTENQNDDQNDDRDDEKEHHEAEKKPVHVVKEHKEHKDKEVKQVKKVEHKVHVNENKGHQNHQNRGHEEKNKGYEKKQWIEQNNKKNHHEEGHGKNGKDGKKD
ncbi:DUF5667 domain-containing protein [Gottfriedia luciferensis]|uniref:DUF5667 domain-containing protein n=1 Tax=Gottfriedia luciferensis TaxID=178774 RepID=UPI000B42EFF0|nr:DUF5667 domain-containing protein [Gottfriedia luciferensis]